jgi:glycosyltransferase involved in cell wall biosynthesis
MYALLMAAAKTASGQAQVDGDTSRPTVAICIPTYNQAHLLALAVASAARQSYSGPLEIWVGDDASTDDTPEVLNSLARNLPNLHVLKQAKNLGIAANNSVLLRQPRAEFIVRLDSDDELEPDYVSRLSALMQDEPQAGYAHTQVSEINERGDVQRIRRLIRSTGFQDAEIALQASLSGYRTTANLLMFRRAALEALHFYDDRPEFVEDYDLAVRMADAGYGNIYVDETLARYRVWTDAAGIRARRKALQLSGYRRIFDECFTSAWKRRGWDLRELTKRRNKLAAHHCASCFAEQYTAAEQEELVRLLLELGDGPGVRLRVGLCRLGLASALRHSDWLPSRAKQIIKTLASGARGLSARRSTRRSRVG